MVVGMVDVMPVGVVGMAEGDAFGEVVVGVTKGGAMEL